METFKRDYSSLVAALLLIATTGTLADHERQLNVHCEDGDLNHLINDGRPFNLTDICGPYFSVHVGDTMMFTSDPSITWTARATLMNAKDDTQKVVSENSGLASSEFYDSDVTRLFRDIPVTTLNFALPECDNIVLIAKLALVGSDGTEMFSATTTRLWCDFTGVNLMLASSDPNPTMMSAVTGDTLSLPTGTTVQADVTGTLPTLANGVCYLATAFLTRHQPGDCTYGDEYSADVSHEDTILSTPVCFTNNAELMGLTMTTLVDSFVIPEGLCGHFYLVLLLDPLHSATTEPKRCDNHVTFEYMIDCPGSDMDSDGRCELVLNPWEMGDMRTNFYNGTDVKMYYYEGDMHYWGVRSMYDMSDLENYGFGSLKLLAAYLQPQIDACVSSASPDVTGMLNALEGHNSEWVFGAGLEADISGLVGVYDQQKAALDGLKTISAGAMTVIDQAINMMEAEKNVMPTTPLDALAHRIKMAVLNSTVFVAKHMYATPDTEKVNWRIKELAHHVPMMMEGVIHYMRELTSSMPSASGMYAQHEVVNFAGNLTAASVVISAMYPEFTCLDTMFRHAVYNMRHMFDPSTGHNGTVEWMYDADVVRNVQLQSPTDDRRIEMCDHQKKFSKCMRKLRNIGNMMWPCDYVAVTADDVCQTKTLVTYARENWSVLGLAHLHTMVDSSDDDKTCNGEPLMPKKSVLHLWKQVHGTPNKPHDFIAVGSLSLDNQKVCWRKMALCTCERCDVKADRKRK